MRPNSTYMAGLYLRLSKDDEGSTESNSISTQRKMLKSYAKERGYPIYDEYIDDGWSGTNFERPGFKRLISDIEDKNINLVLVKDLSRLGRDYILTGQYTEIYFPSKSVRCIAINDGYDSDSPYNDVVPFKNVINEMYARDTSKKVRSAFITNMREGNHVASFPPFGYKRDPENPRHLIIDEPAAEIVREIFQLAFQGVGNREIARILNERQVPTPLSYRCMNKSNLDISTYKSKGEWIAPAIYKMLANRMYLGDMVQHKTTKVSFKSGLQLRNSPEDWIIVRETHDPIIEREVFDIVRRRSKAKYVPQSDSFKNIFAGLAWCDTCGRRMSPVHSRKRPYNLVCMGYKQHGPQVCSTHGIHYKVLYDLVLESLNEQISLSAEERLSILEDFQKAMEAKRKGAAKEVNTARLKKRIQEIDVIVEKLYEDFASDIINAERFSKLMSKYEAESQMLTNKIGEAADKAKHYDTFEIQEAYDKFEKIISQYDRIEELTQELLFKLVERIEVSEPWYEATKTRKKLKHQTVRIFYRFQAQPTVKEYSK